MPQSQPPSHGRENLDEVEHLHRELELKDQESLLKDAEIRRLERASYRPHELHHQPPQPRLRPLSDHRNNPHPVNSKIHSRGDHHPRRSSRLLDAVYGGMLVLLFGHVYNMVMIQHSTGYTEETTAPNSLDGQASVKDNVVVRRYGPLKPWESSPPIPIALMDSSTKLDDFVKHRHSCIQEVRHRQKIIFDDLLAQDMHMDDDLQILLVDPAYHRNVGDHMLTLGELYLIQETLQQPTPKQCHYVQAGGFYPVCTDMIRSSDRDGTKLALWHAGGNWGDLWRDAQDVRIPSIKTLLENNYRVIGLPQSLFYLNETLKTVDVVSIKENVALGLGLAKSGRLPWDPIDTSKLDTAKGIKLAKSKVVFMWREKESYEEALELYPFVSNMVVPDMGFQLGPYAPIRKYPEKMVDIIVFLRDDIESQVFSMRHFKEVMKLLPTPGLTFKIVDWANRLTMFDTTDYFFTNSSIELLSLGKVVVCDRLHAAILSYISGIPFVYIDQVSGKITKTLSAAFDNIGVCLDKKRSRWARASSLEEALVKASAMISP